MNADRDTQAYASYIRLQEVNVLPTFCFKHGPLVFESCNTLAHHINPFLDGTINVWSFLKWTEMLNCNNQLDEWYACPSNHIRFCCVVLISSTCTHQSYTYTHQANYKPFNVIGCIRSLLEMPFPTKTAYVCVRKSVTRDVLCGSFCTKKKGSKKIYYQKKKQTTLCAKHNVLS